MSTTAVSRGGRVWKKVRLREDEPPDDCGNAAIEGIGSSKPFSFRDAVLNSSLVVEVLRMIG